MRHRNAACNAASPMKYKVVRGMAEREVSRSANRMKSCAGLGQQVLVRAVESGASPGHPFDAILERVNGFDSILPVPGRRTRDTGRLHRAMRGRYHSARRANHRRSDFAAARRPLDHRFHLAAGPPRFMDAILCGPRREPASGAVGHLHERQTWPCVPPGHIHPHRSLKVAQLPY